METLRKKLEIDIKKGELKEVLKSILFLRSPKDIEEILYVLLNTYEEFMYLGFRFVKQPKQEWKDKNIVYCKGAIEIYITENFEDIIYNRCGTLTIKLTDDKYLQAYFEL